MASKLCATPLTVIISTLAVVVAYYWPKPYTFPALIGVGGLMTVCWSYYKKETLPPVRVGALGARGRGTLTHWTRQNCIRNWHTFCAVSMLFSQDV